MASWSAVRSTLEDWLLAQGPGSFSRIIFVAAVVYLVALLVVRLGKKRFIGRNTVFDAILGFMLGSTLSRTINGSGPLVASVAAAFVLVALHWFFGEVASRFEGFSRILSGKPHVLVDNGRVDRTEMHRHNLSDDDLEQAIVLSGVSGGAAAVQLARFERSGAISVVPQRFAHVVDVEVQEGVQTVRVVLEGRS